MMLGEDAERLVYRGEVLRQDADRVALRLGEGVEIEVPAAGIDWMEQTAGSHGAVLTTLRLLPGAEVQARFAAGGATLAAGSPTPLPLIAYDLSPPGEVSLVPGGAARAWMNASNARWAYRCLPLLIANQHGWEMLNTRRFTAIWDGGLPKQSIQVEHSASAPGMAHYASSHFGHGVLTFRVPYLIRTPPGYSLYVRGPANMPKDAISPLEGIVETDWSDATFTMNWMFTRPNQRVVFEEDEPIAVFAPVRRGEVERFRPVFRGKNAAPEIQAGHDAFAASRTQHIRELDTLDDATRRSTWQRHYMRGTTVTGKQAREHQTSLKLSDFVEEGGEEQDSSGTD